MDLFENDAMKLSVRFQYLAVPIILAACLLSRLPLLLDQTLYLDGDECILALMAKHFLEGKGLPLFFYGQAYGFSLFEVLTIRFFYAVFGVSDFAVKVSMLFLWSLGVVFFYKSMKEVEPARNTLSPFLVTLALVFAPAWGIGSMKARGGYITAFLLSLVVTYLIFNRRWNRLLRVAFIAGFLLVVIFQSQPLTLAPLIPIVCFYMYKKRSEPHAIYLPAGVITGMAVFLFLKQGISSYWTPDVFGIPALNADVFVFVLKQIYKNLAGTYSYSTFDEPSLITNIVAIIYMSVIFLSLGLGVLLFIKRWKINPWFYVICLSVASTISYQFIITKDRPRYLHPLCILILLLVYFFINRGRKKWVVNSFLGTLIILSAISMTHVLALNFGNKAAVLKLIDNIQSRRINYVYCERALWQWQIMFYSNEDIIARYRNKTDRYPDYVKRVDAAFKDPTVKVALVGWSHGRPFIKENPTKELLIRHRFEFEEDL